MVETRKDQTARIEIKDTIMKALEKDKSIPLERTIAIMSLDSGRTMNFIKNVILAMQKAEIIIVNENKDLILLK